MTELKKELLYPTIVGIVVGAVLLFGDIAVEEIRKPEALPPAEILYGYSSKTLNDDELSEIFPEKFKDNEERETIFISTIFLTNASGRSLNDLNFVAQNRFYRPSSWLKVDVETSDAILAQAIDNSSLDKNGNLRFEISKFGQDGTVEITVKSNDLSFVPELDTPNTNVKLRNVIVPQYMYFSTPTRTNSDWSYLFALIGALLSSVGAYFSAKKFGPKTNV